MFSGSSSYLGGNSGRPGQQQQQQQYGNSLNPNQSQSPFQSQPPNSGFAQPQATGFMGGYNQQQQMQPQATGFSQQQMQQPTGFGQPQMQSAQPTGFQSQQTNFQPQSQQPQQTGFGGGAFNQQQMQTQPTGYGAPQQQQSFQTGIPPVPPMPQQQSQPALMKPQATGFAQMAASFQSTPPPEKPAGRRAAAKAGAKIPNIRLSFITAADQAKFETLFRSAAGNGQTLSGDKSRDLLMRSKLDGNALSQIWTLADTTRSGQLHFPEFALAMYLCNLRLVGKQLPSSLPENIKNEVSSMVDIINFGVEDDASPSTPQTNAPDFTMRNTATPPIIQAPQPQASNSQLLTAQMTGFPLQQTGFGGFAPQQLGYQGNQQTGFNGQQQGLQSQPTNFGNMSNPQPTGYNGPLPPMPPMPTGFGGQGNSMIAPLNAQPTGMPGQWGLVNAPATGLPNIDLLQQRMMPQAGREAGSYSTQGLAGNATIPWAVTKDEKTRYDSLFKAWDGFGKGFIGGDQAIEIFGQSGLEKNDLERVWTLADHGNKGRLNMDEFAVAMHLIYRKLNGYPLPAQLPPELTPPSTRNFNESIGQVKNMLHQESDFRKNSGAALLPQKTGVSYLKSHSFRGDTGGARSGRKDATVFKNNDNDVGYRSSARRRMGNGSESPRPSSPGSVNSNDDLTIEQLRKKVREKQVVLDSLDFKDENAADEDDALDRRDRRDADDLYRRIRRVQEDIDAHPDASLNSVDSGAERRALKRQLQVLTDKLPNIASQVRRTERSIAEARLELFRLKDAKAHPGSASAIVGTGPGGSVTESDRLKARAKAMMQQRSAALTGKKIEGADDALEAPKRLEEENIKIRNEKENNERMVKDVEEGVREFSRSIEDSLKEGGDTNVGEHEKRRWEDGLGVEDEVKEFIFDMQRSSRSARVRNNDRSSSRREEPAPAQPARFESARATPPPPSSSARSTPTPSAGGGSYASYKTPEERAAFIKQQAEQRMAERLAALGIKAPSKGGETTQQRLEREKAEKAEKVRVAEEADAKREAERQARLNEEQGISAPAPEAPKAPGPRKPAPPPSRKAARSDASEKKAEEVNKEAEATAIATRDLQNEAARQEAELARERQEAQARLLALEEQVKAGKIKKEEEKRRKKAAQAEAKAKEAKLAAQRAEIERAQERERELQRQLAAIDDEDSSDDDDEGPQQATPQASTPTMSQDFDRERSPPQSVHVSAFAPPPTSPPVPAFAQPPTSPPAPAFAPPPASPPVPTPPSITSPQADTTSPQAETRNPFLKKLAAEQSSSSQQSSTSTVSESTNPFHRLTQATSSPAPAPLTTQPTGPGGRPSRVRPEEDEWSVVGSDKDDDSSDDENPGAGNAKMLASMLFGTMAPPRPLSASGNGAGSTPTSPAPASNAFAPPPPPPGPPPMPMGSAPPPPPMPTGSAPPPPPMPSGVPGAPPPPPPPGAGPPPPPMPNMGSAAPPAGRPMALLGDIQAGRQLKKVQTKDRSTSSVAGRVLD